MARRLEDGIVLSIVCITAPDAMELRLVRGPAAGAKRSNRQARLLAAMLRAEAMSGRRFENRPVLRPVSPDQAGQVPPENNKIRAALKPGSSFRLRRPTQEHVGDRFGDCSPHLRGVQAWFVDPPQIARLPTVRCRG